MSGTMRNSNAPAKAGDEADASRSPGGIQTHLAWLCTRMALETTPAGEALADSMIAEGQPIPGGVTWG